nr:hypothetical protein [uncultured Bacteroides sp.]
MAKELFALLAEAREIYLHDVVSGGKLYGRFVDDFINSHRYIDCDNAVCRNCHEMNLHIARVLLADLAARTRLLFTADTLSFEDCMELKKMYDLSDPNMPIKPDGTGYALNAPPLSFDCNFTEEQMTGIVACANAYHLFCVSAVSIEDMEALFACKEGFRIRVNNLRHVAVLFDALLECSCIQAHWQSVLERGKFLVSKDGKRFVTASSLSTALSAARSCMTSTTMAIRKSISQLRE